MAFSHLRSDGPLASRTIVSFNGEVDFKVLRRLLLFAIVLAQVGCATTNEGADDATPALEPSQSHEDDSHGWGANLAH